MSAQRSTRARSLVATAAVAVLGIAALTACEVEEPTKETGAGSSQQKDRAGDAEDGADAEAARAGEQLAAGETAAYESGLKITVSEAAAYTPGEYAIGHTEGNTAHRLTITLENTGEEKIDAALVLASARAGEEGASAEEIYDDEIGGGFQGKLLPGKKATAEYAFDAPADAENLDLEIDLLDFTTEPAQWSLAL